MKVSNFSSPSNTKYKSRTNKAGKRVTVAKNKTTGSKTRTKSSGDFSKYKSSSTTTNKRGKVTEKTKSSFPVTIMFSCCQLL